MGLAAQVLVPLVGVWWLLRVSLVDYWGFQPGPQALVWVICFCPTTLIVISMMRQLI